MATITALPHYEATELAALTEQQLLDLMIKDEDRVPRNVIDECAGRGDAMVTALCALVADEVDWGEESQVQGKWWLRLHAVMILGLMESDAAGDLLIAYMRRMDYEGDDSLQDWFAGHWPALFANKPLRNIDQLKDFAEDDRPGIWLRHEASDARVYWFRTQGGQALEDELDWLVGFATDDDNEMDFRMITGNLLLEYPRERFRAVLEKLAGEQQGWSRIYDKSDVARAFQRGADKPKWEPFNNPWLFYLPDNIAARQKRWQEEDERRERRKVERLFSPDEFDPERDNDYEFVETYVRETPKIGRNDPCPCGSGKKYKKCCLGKEA